MVTNFQRVISFANKKYTFLAILVLGCLGSLIVLWNTKRNRFRFIDWWNWKKRAIKNIVIYWLILIAIKLLLGGL